MEKYTVTENEIADTVIYWNDKLNEDISSYEEREFIPINLRNKKKELTTQQRIALIIGNSKYTDKTLPEIEFCIDDVKHMKNALNIIGFEVITEKNQDISIDLTKESMDDKIGEFIDKLTDNSIALIYFSGHGCHNDLNENFMLPVDHDMAGPLDNKSYICANKTMSTMEKIVTQGACIGIFDACRVYESKGPNEQLSVDTVGMKSVNVNGCITAYSCKESEQSMQGTELSLYTECLLQHIYKPFDISTIFRLANYTLYMHKKNKYSDNTRKQHSTYIDALRGTDPLILNNWSTNSSNTDRIVHFWLRKKRICRRKPSANLVWASNFSENERDYTDINANTGITIVTKGNWCVPADDDAIIVTKAHDAKRPSGNTYPIDEGQIWKLSRDASPSKPIILMQGKYSSNPAHIESVRTDHRYITKQDNYWLVEEELEVDPNFIRKLEGYWVKVKTKTKTYGDYEGYIHSTSIPPYISQCILP